MCVILKTVDFSYSMILSCVESLDFLVVNSCTTYLWISILNCYFDIIMFDTVV